MTHSRFVDKKLEVRAMLPGLRVEYSTDDGVTWSDVTLETEVDGRVKLRTRYEFFSEETASILLGIIRVEWQF